jgi:uncharacterized protein YgiM (DUF1202 family)
MYARLLRCTAFGLSLALILAACNMPTAQATPAPDVAATYVVATLSAIETANASAPVLVPATVTQTSTPTGTALPPATPQNPLVVKDALCWQGPGAVYEVTSSVKTGTRVELLGRGSVGAWWIIRNPIYHDPCWVQTDVLQIEAGYNLSGLQVFNPPPTPTPIPTHTPTVTPTPP